MGNDLIKQFSRFAPDIEPLHKILKISPEWKDEDFDRTNTLLKSHRLSVTLRQGDISSLFNHLQKNGDLLLRLIENPIIQEHENFTEMLRALFHLRDELLHRNDLVELLDSDRNHLEGDIARVYNLLVFEWLRYVRYLKKNYGFLYSLAVRTNPFDPEATVVVKNY
jgi:hypothetical protein